MSYNHVAVDRQTYERTGQPLLDYQQLKGDVHSFLTIAGDVTSAEAILHRLAVHGSEQCLEWYKLLQILATFAIRANEAERTFSPLRRIKSWLRNSLNDLTLEILVKMSTLKIDLTDHAIKFIIEDLINNPQRAKSRNVSVFIEGNDVEELDDDII